MHCSRRTCLGILALGAFSLTALAHTAGSELSAIERFLSNRPDAALLGRHCFDLLGIPKSEIEHQLLERLKRQSGSISGLESYRDAIQSDFKAGAIKLLEGWPVSETEALAYAWHYTRSAT